MRNNKNCNDKIIAMNERISQKLMNTSPAPKINAENKKIFEELIPPLEEYARSMGGTMEAFVDPDIAIAFITLTLPFFYCSTDEEIELFSTVAKKADGFCIKAADDGQVMLTVDIEYFEPFDVTEEEMSEESADRIYRNIMKKLNK